MLCVIQYCMVSSLLVTDVECRQLSVTSRTACPHSPWLHESVLSKATLSEDDHLTAFPWTCVSVCIGLYLSMFVCVSVYELAFICLYVSVYVLAFICPCVCVCIVLYLSMCLCMYWPLSVCLCVWQLTHRVSWC